MRTAMSDFLEIPLAEAAHRLLESERVLIFVHQNPDGDCVGSGFALAEMLRNMGKSAYVVCADEIPKRLRFLMRGQDDCRYTEGMEDGCDLLCAVDTASVSQLGALGALAPKITLSLDHHESNAAFSDNCTCPDAAACGELLFDLYGIFQDMGHLQHLADVCRLLYAAIVSDTGSFKFANTTRDTLLKAADLVDAIRKAEDGGDDLPMINHRLFENRTMTELYAQRAGIDALRFAHSGEVGVVVFTAEMLRENGITLEDIGNIVSLPRAVEGVKIAVSVKQSLEDPTVWRVSSRASVDVDVAAVCAAFGGGGHRRAAGCTVSAPDADTAFSIVAEAFCAVLDRSAMEVKQ